MGTGAVHCWYVLYEVVEEAEEGKEEEGKDEEEEGKEEDEGYGCCGIAP